MKNPCRYIANEATWRLKPGGGIVNKTVYVFLFFIFN